THPRRAARSRFRRCRNFTPVRTAPENDRRQYGIDKRYAGPVVFQLDPAGGSRAALRAGRGTENTPLAAFLHAHGNGYGRGEKAVASGGLMRCFVSIISIVIE